MKRVLAIALTVVSLWAIDTDTTSELGNPHELETSLALRGVDLHTGLSLLAESNGFRLRVDTVISGDVEVDLEGVKLPQALNMLLKERGLHWRFDRETLIIEGENERVRPALKGNLYSVTGTDGYRIFTIN